MFISIEHVAYKPPERPRLMARQSTSRHAVAVFRRAKGWTQKELAKVLGVSARTVQAIELGQMNLPEKHRLKIAQLEGKDLIPLIEGRVGAYRQRLYHTAGIVTPATEGGVRLPVS